MNLNRPPSRGSPGRLSSVLLASMVVLLANRGSAAEPILRVSDADKVVAFTAEEFRRLPHSTISAFDSHSRMEHRYSGIPVRDILLKVGAPLGDEMRGPALRLAVVVRANDGYATLFALAEFDASSSDRMLFLADSEDGKPLGAGAGPLGIVALGDRRAARRARIVKSIEVVQLPDAPAHS
jgi:hypothetical protein